MLSRFLINLRQADSTDPSEAGQISQFSRPDFRVPSLPTVIGNLGEPLAYGEEDLDDDVYAGAELHEGYSDSVPESGKNKEISDVLNTESIGIEEVNYKRLGLVS
ncbi:hypothetical protein NM688_g2161 [Phlebia brevispora]|uniref:Uncharacterized protein n=1 Tax=Phlebia brevispora TaxID=194682 RepID=A0ACC1T9G0_9APHY|nr:hypothetical protein NM688_g2161 [Phlebia brevispora]